jgi:hypothetical protein
VESASETNAINPGYFAEYWSETDRGSNDASPFAVIGNCTEMEVTPRRKIQLSSCRPDLISKQFVAFIRGELFLVYWQ